MSAKNKPAAPVAATAVITGAELMAKKTELPVKIVEVLAEIGTAATKMQGGIQKLAAVITEWAENTLELGAEWCLVTLGDVREEAEPVHELRDRIIGYYENDLGHSNGSAVWNAAKGYAKADLLGEEGEKRGKKENKGSLDFLLGNGSYEYGKNKGAAVRMYRRIALDAAGKKAQPALRLFQTKLGEALEAIGFDVSQLQAKPDKDAKK